MSGPNDWNPEDGPPPTDEELREAAEFERALSAVLPAKSQTESKSTAAPKLSEGSLALLDAALRAHATDHAPSDAQVDRAVRAAVDRASQKSAAHSPARRWLARVTAAAAVLIAGVVGGRIAQQSRSAQPAASDAASISRAADDVFTSALGPEPGSDPITRIESARMRDFRGHLFARGGRGR